MKKFDNPHEQLKLNQLEMLVAVADAGSFNGAAAEMGCTQSRISHAIAELERVLGTRLLLRSRAGCVPTESGLRVIAKARQILTLTASLAQSAEPEESPVGRVRIACFRSVGTHLLPTALETLAIDYPGIRVDVDDGYEEREAVTRAVEEGRADVGIAQLPVGAAVVTRPYVSDAYVIVAPSSLPLQAPLSWEQLHGVPYIQLSCSGALAVLDRCRAAGFAAEPSRTLATDSSIVAMVKRGIGYSVLPHLAVFPPPDGVQVHDLPIPAKREFVLAALPSIARLKSVETVVRLIRAERSVSGTDAYRAGVVRW
jgi:DNA-binding transcriptional LysR family regulator